MQWTGADNHVRIARGFERTLAFEQYEPIALVPQSLSPTRSSWLFDDGGQRAAREFEARGALFEMLGDA